MAEIGAPLPCESLPVPVERIKVGIAEQMVGRTLHDGATGETDLQGPKSEVVATGETDLEAREEIAGRACSVSVERGAPRVVLEEMKRNE